MLMETNETILTREVVVLDTRKKLGSIQALRLDGNTMAVSHYVVNNVSTGSVLALPFEKAISVGDVFVTVQKRDDFLASNDAESNKVLQEGYALLGEEVFSKTGNRLSPVKSFEFDPIHGAITQLGLQDGTIFSAESFLFFSPDFVFVDDGAPTAAEIRAGGVTTDTATATSSEAASPQAALTETNVPEEPTHTAPEALPEEETKEEEIDLDEDVLEFLVGAALLADVESENGKFQALKGTVLTYEMVRDAAKHDAVLLLTVNVEV